MKYKDMIFVKEIVELTEAVCGRCSFETCGGNCSVKEQIMELGEKIMSLKAENETLTKRVKFWESEANASKYEEYV